MTKEIPYVCSECGHMGRQKVSRVDPPQRIIVENCTPDGCIFYHNGIHTSTRDYCILTKSRVKYGEFPENCPVNKKILEISTAEVNY